MTEEEVFTFITNKNGSISPQGLALYLKIQRADHNELCETIHKNINLIMAGKDIAIQVSTICDSFVLLPTRRQEGALITCSNKCCAFLVDDSDDLVGDRMYGCPICEKKVRFLITRLSNRNGVEAGCFKCFKYSGV